MARGDDPLLLGHQLCFALYDASRSLIRAYAPLLEPLGLTYPQYLVMLVLWEQDGVSVKALGERLSLDSGTLTPLLKRMEQHGLVARKRDGEDERVVRIHLSAAGKKLRERARKVPLQIACSAGFDVADPSELARLQGLREQLVALSKSIAADDE
jgi:MarR family transcriptional regulator, organic hydroperoxide resistance regulator